MPAGSIVIFDCRIYHQGAANQALHDRPIYYSMWGKTWFAEKKYFGSRSLVDESQQGLHTGELVGFDTLPEAQLEPLQLFLNAHAAQLKALNVPRGLWGTLASKLGVLEAGAQDVLDMGSCVAVQHSGDGYGVVATKDLIEFEQIWMLDHVWSFEGVQQAVLQLAVVPGLLENLIGQLLISDLKEDLHEQWHQVLSCAITKCSAYTVASADGESSVAQNYVLDIVGSHLTRNDDDPVAHVSGVFVNCFTQQAYSLCWPVRACAAGEYVTCSMGSNGANLCVPELDSSEWSELVSQANDYKVI